MKRNDPHTGRFATGNPGRAKGSKNERTRLWEELGEQLTDRHAERFNALLDRLWDSPDVADQLRAADLFLKVAEYFRPKLQRMTGTVETRTIQPPVIEVSGQYLRPDGKGGLVFHPPEE